MSTGVNNELWWLIVNKFIDIKCVKNMFDYRGIGTRARRYDIGRSMLCGILCGSAGALLLVGSIVAFGFNEISTGLILMGVCGFLLLLGFLSWMLSVCLLKKFSNPIQMGIKSNFDRSKQLDDKLQVPIGIPVQADNKN
eukprot:TRINITY_DN4577_c1_g6_i2.p2 TRINITY_DN4577_c1_g6~~TRINITY_DN4577_c1_g6_i2.p2  ORF type:complete len:139 (+),score=5.69 TRINITY_DN4577_c1_g6_i2:218-634(+)